MLLESSPWYNTDTSLPEEKVSEMKADKTDYFIQFRVVNSNDINTTVSKSVRILLFWPEEPFPYVISSNIDPCVVYDVNTKSVRFSVSLTFNDMLFGIDETGVIVDSIYSVPTDKLLGETYIQDVSSCLYTNYETVDGTEYKMDYTNITFDIKLPTNHLMETTDDLTYNCLYTFTNVEGKNTQKAPNSFMFSISVPPVPPLTLAESIKIYCRSAIVYADKPSQLTAEVFPANVTDPTVTWSSSNPKYATVDQDGVVTPKIAGAGRSVVIIAKANDGSNVVKTCELFICAIPVESIAIHAATDHVKAGDKLTLSVIYTPSYATTKIVTWSSSNEKYATVDRNGVVKTKAAGAGKTVTITATWGNQKKASFQLKIDKSDKIFVKKLKITGKKTVKAGKKVSLKVKVTPSNATSKSVKWSTSNKKYATVNSKGVVTAKKAGKGKTVTITAKAKDGSGKKASIRIRIK